ncbi:MAG: RidA family protein [Alphaproteobacteria bacterium]|nr:RidA family protein [Alphaproteobacteria bacterium]
MPKVWYENPPGTAPAQGLYSHVGSAQGGRLAFVAGQLSVNTRDEIVGKGDFEAQFRQVFSNMGDVLKGLGCDFNSVVKFTTLFVHSQDIETFMRLRRELFPRIFKGPLYPPNTIMVIDRLVKEEFLFELEAVVAVD